MNQVAQNQLVRFIPSAKNKLPQEYGRRAHRQMQEAAREVVRQVQGDLARRRL